MFFFIRRDTSCQHFPQRNSLPRPPGRIAAYLPFAAQGQYLLHQSCSNAAITQPISSFMAVKTINIGSRSGVKSNDLLPRFLD